MTTTRIAEIKARLAAASGHGPDCNCKCQETKPGDAIAFDQSAADTVFIANAHADIACLVAELGRARAVIEAVRLADSGELSHEMGEPVAHIRTALEAYDEGGE
jgi:hypothetical protein